MNKHTKLQEGKIPSFTEFTKMNENKVSEMDEEESVVFKITFDADNHDEIDASDIEDQVERIVNKYKSGNIDVSLEAGGNSIKIILNGNADDVLDAHDEISDELTELENDYDEVDFQFTNPSN
jgi:hypothetical protein